MEEVSKKKSTFWSKCFGWFKQIFYIFSWIIIITFIKSDDASNDLILLLAFIAEDRHWSLENFFFIL
jgi:hypothetical protein